LHTQKGGNLAIFNNKNTTFLFFSKHKKKSKKLKKLKKLKKNIKKISLIKHILLQCHTVAHTKRRKSSNFQQQKYNFSLLFPTAAGQLGEFNQLTTWNHEVYHILPPGFGR
jgi:hypothetical protein